MDTRAWAPKLSLLLSLLAALQQVQGSTVSLQRRSVQSQAVCQSQFSWMDNSLAQSPCLVAGFLLSECAGGDWTVQPVTQSSHYSPPNATNANGCKCSWAVYNTLQACADCQGQDFESAMLSWVGYNPNCTGDLLSSTDYYPPDTPIPDDTAIPFWATTNPSTWRNAIFDPSTAQSLASEDKSDVKQSTRFSSKKSNTGAIVGGVVGGLAALAALGCLGWLRVRRRGTAAASGSKRSNIRFSPLSHFSHSRGPSTSDDMQHKDGAYLTSASPQPSIPTTANYTNGHSRPPFNLTHSSSSFTTQTFSPPSSYMMNTNPQKQLLHYPPGIAPMITMNESTTAISSAGATVNHAQGHAHSFSNGSITSAGGVSGMTMSHDRALSIGSAGEQMEGAISPFIMPPFAAEAMTSEEVSRSETPSAKARSAAGSPEPGATMAVSRKAQRLNPPAYIFDAGRDASNRDASAASEAGDSAAAQAPDSSMSGTTLRQASAPTTSGTNVGSSVIAEEGPTSRHERDQYGYPTDRKE